MGCKNLNLFHGAHISLCLNEVANLVGLKKQNHNPSCKILKGSLEGQSNGQTSCTKNRNK